MSNRSWLRYWSTIPTCGFGWTIGVDERLAKLTEFLKMLQERAASRGVALPGKVASDPKDLGQVLTDLHEEPGQLRDILGGILSSPQAKAVLAGIAAMVVKRVMQGASRTA